MLYWLTETVNDEYNRSLIIESESYTATLRWTINGLITEVQNTSKHAFSTRITLDCKKQNFSSDNLKKIEKYLRRLKFIEGAMIFVNSTRLNSCKSKNRIDIVLNKNIFQITDNATGITQNTLFNSLLVPSSSTKTMQNDLNTETILPEPIESLNFTIVVNGVIIFEYLTDGYVIFMPANSKLPVSRENIIYDDHSIAAFKLQIRKIFEKISTTRRNINNLMRFLNIYDRKTSQPKLTDAIVELKAEILSTNFVFIPEKPIWNKLIKILSFDYIFYNQANSLQIEEKLRDQLDLISNASIFKLKNIIFLDSEEVVNTAGLLRYVFISENYIEDNVDWITNISNGINGLRLIPSDLDEEPVFEKYNFTKLHNNIQSFNYFVFDNVLNPEPLPEDYDILIKQVCLLWNKKFERIDINFGDTKIGNTFKTNSLGVTKENFIHYMCLMCYNNCKTDITEFIFGLNSYISQIVFKITYGSKIDIKFDIRNNHQIKVNADIFYQNLSNYFDLIKKRFNKLSLRDSQTILSCFKYRNQFLSHNLHEILTDEYYSIIKSDEKLHQYFLVYFKFFCQKYKVRSLQPTENNTEIVKLIEKYKFIPSDDSLILQDFRRYNYQIYLYWTANIFTEIGNSPNIITPDSFTFNFEDLSFLPQNIIDEMRVGMLNLTTEERITFALTMTRFISLLFSIDPFSNAPEALSNFRLDPNGSSLFNFEEINGIGNFLANNIRKIANLSTAVKNLVTRKRLNFTNYQNTILIPLIVSLKQYRLLNKHAKLESIPIISHNYTFTAKSLIQYLYLNDTSGMMIEQLFENVTRHQYVDFDAKLQVIEIAVNAGTAKSFASSVITELIQNSIDAIRENSSKKKLKLISIDVSLNAFSVTDYIGFESLTEIMIPFLSSKDANNPNVTGEMGSGFFNIYRYPFCDRVVIETRKNEIETVIIAVPLIRDGLVCDIHYEIQRNQSKNPNMTKIKVFVKDDNREQLIETITEAYIYADTYSGIIPGIDVELNKVKIVKESELIYESEIGDVYYVHDKRQISTVLTNGVPFARLENFLDDFTEIVYSGFINASFNSIVINFNKSFYTPSQTRTKIEFSDYSKVCEFINYSIYIFLLKIERIDYQNNIPNMYSKADISQLTFTLRDVSLPKNLYIPTTQVMLNYNGFAETINRHINALLESSEPQKYLKKLKNHKFDRVDLKIINDTIYSWFAEKDIKPKPKTTKKTESEKVQWDLIQKFTKCYWNIILRLIENGLISGANPQKREPQVYVSELSEITRGLYNKNEHAVYLNRNFFNISELDRVIQSANIKSITSNSKLSDIFSNSNPPNTLIHEIGHAITNMDCKTGSHDMTTITLNGEDNDKKLHFYDMCLEVYNLAIMNGLFTEFYRQLRV